MEEELNIDLSNEEVESIKRVEEAVKLFHQKAVLRVAAAKDAVK